jgi:hypothetical protein
MTPSELIDRQIASFTDWRGEVMKQLRSLVHEADPEITEEWKWEVGVYTHEGMVCAMSAFKDHVKLNFFKGAKLQDKNKLINAGLESKSHRSIDFFEGDNLDETKIKDLISEAVSLNTVK